MNNKEKERIGISEAINYFSKKNIPVYLPIGDSGCDLVVDWNGFKMIEARYSESINYRTKDNTTKSKYKLYELNDNENLPNLPNKV